MKNLHTFEEFINESLNEGDMTRDYDGFIVSDTDSKKNLNWKFKYIKGTKNNKVEDEAIAKVMRETGKSRADYWVNGFVKKGEWNKSDAQEI
jgi:agmatine/peptidylarginine deiminase